MTICVNIKLIQIHLKDIGRINTFAYGTLKKLIGWSQGMALMPHCEEGHFCGAQCYLPSFLFGKLFWHLDNLFLTFKLYFFFFFAQYFVIIKYLQFCRNCTSIRQRKRGRDAQHIYSHLSSPSFLSKLKWIPGFRFIVLRRSLIYSS